MAAKIATMAIMIISSINVKPRLVETDKPFMLLLLREVTEWTV